MPLTKDETILFNFEHLAIGQSFRLTVAKHSLGHDIDGNESITFRTFNEEKAVGYIKGRLVGNDKKAFVVKTSISTQRPDSKDRVPVPRAVGATILQIVLYSVVPLWLSSDRLSDDGKRMYEEYIQKNPEVVVTRESGRYSVKKRY